MLAAPSQGRAELENRHPHGPKLAPTHCCPAPRVPLRGHRRLTSRSHWRPPNPGAPPVSSQRRRGAEGIFGLRTLRAQETTTNKKGSSDHLANHLGAARPGGATSRTVALTTAHSSHQCREPAPHHLSPWLGQPIASRVPALGPAYWSKSCGDASMEAT